MALFCGTSISNWQLCPNKLCSVLTNHFSWHWMFLINLAPALIIASIVWAYLDIDKPDWKLWHVIDWLGLLSMALFLGSLEYTLDEGLAMIGLPKKLLLSVASSDCSVALSFFGEVLLMPIRLLIYASLLIVTLPLAP